MKSYTINSTPVFLIIIILSTLFGTFFGTFNVVGGTVPSIAQNETLLSRLDSILENHEKLVIEKEIRIDGLRQTLHRSKSNADRLSLCRQLYDEYLVFDSDSALYYATEASRLANLTNPQDYNLTARLKINEAFIYTVQGLYDNALTILESIDSSRLKEETLASYFESIGYLHSMRSVYLQGTSPLFSEELRKANTYRDSIMTTPLAPDSEWLWVPVAMALDNPLSDVPSLDITNLKKTVEASTTPSRKNAINSYWLARYYERIGNETEMVKYKTKAAIFDALIVNREIAALQELATYMFEKGDINRAYSYLIYAENQVNLYHNRFRMVSLSDILPTVRNKYKADLEKRDRRLSLMVWLLAVLSGILLVCIVFIILEFNKLKKMQNLLKEANDGLNVSIKERDCAITELESANKELQAINHKLNEANSQKLGLLAYAFKLSANHLNELEDYRKKLLKKYKGKHFDELGILINDPELIKEHYQSFFESFDKMVLSLFPDFIEEYNRSVSSENQVAAETIRKTKTLNTRLRIYALKRLGVSKSSDIASMLNVSIRTVYNNKNHSSGTETE